MASSPNSWLCSDLHEFSLQNLPYGVFSVPVRGLPPRCGVAIGDHAIDLAVLSAAGLLDGLPGLTAGVFGQPTLNGFMATARPTWQAVRARLTALLRSGSDGDPALRDNAALRAVALVPLVEVEMHLPAKIGDYTDFYSSREHATNVGIMMRGAANALQPNWLHLPVGYHGRASSVYLSGVDVVRPMGQLQKDPADDSQGSVFGACKLMDFELEMAFFVGGPPLAPGASLDMADAEDHIFGLVLMNDWSARDIQKWEYVPLGPFGAKNFATSISPWVVTLDALAPFRCATSAGTQHAPPPLAYLADPTYSSYDVQLEVAIQGQGMAAPAVVCRSNFRNLYWTCKQQLVHHAVTGCNMQPGDLLGSGTISGTPQGSFGSMLELSWKGTRDVELGADSGQVRKFLQDQDLVVMSGKCGPPQAEGVPCLGAVGFGTVRGTVLPAGTVLPPLHAGQCNGALPPQPAFTSVGPAPAAAAASAAPAAAAAAVNPASRFSQLVLHGYWRSSCSWRVRVALAAKGLAYEYRAVNLLEAAHVAAAHVDSLCPLGQVPVLTCCDALLGGKCVTVTQSLAIVAFLEEAFPHHGASLLPLDPVARAAARELAEMVNAGTQPLQNLAVVKHIDALTSQPGCPPGTPPGTPQGKAFAHCFITAGLTALEATAQAHLAAQPAARSAFLGGLSIYPTVADACLVPQLFNARRFHVDLAPFPHLLAVERACAAHPWFAAAHPDAQPDALDPSAAAAAVAAASKRGAADAAGGETGGDAKKSKA